MERDTQRLLCDLSQGANVAVQWIPTHCGRAGNEEADRLARHGSTLEQHNHKVSYREAKTLLKSKIRSCSKELKDHNPEDPMLKLPRKQQVVIFRLRTGHCRLRSHLHRLGLSHTPDCPCDTSPHTPEHVIQCCPDYKDLRNQQWPNGATLAEKLWGTKQQLTQTIDFISSTNLEIWGAGLRNAKEEEDCHIPRPRQSPSPPATLLKYYIDVGPYIQEEKWPSG